MQLIWRLQSKEGKGFYRSLVYQCELEQGYFHYKKHPSPCEEIVFGSSKVMQYLLTDKHIFGFNCLWKLKKWFQTPSDLERMSELGHLAVFDKSKCEYVYSGKTQTVFIPKHTPLLLDPSSVYSMRDLELTQIAISKLKELIK